MTTAKKLAKEIRLSAAVARIKREALAAAKPIRVRPRRRIIRITIFVVKGSN